jgi:cell division protease FtsH
LLDRLDVYLGGRVAEELVFGDISTGAQNDLQMANDMERHMVTQYGMSDKLGLATYEEVHAPYLNPSASAEQKPYSEHTAETIDAEISKLLDEAHTRVRNTLHEKRHFLDMLAKMLLEKETVDRAALDALIKEHGDAPVSLAQ